jgi:hypothetical protein
VKRLIIVLLAGALAGGCTTLSDGAPRLAGDGPPLRGIGYAVIAIQPGETPAQKQLMAIRASRLAAMRDLAERIHGARIEGNTAIGEGQVFSDNLRGSVAGLVTNARVVSITPVRNTLYETILEVDVSEVNAMRASHRPLWQ